MNRTSYLFAIPVFFRQLRGRIWRRILSQPVAHVLRYFYGVSFGLKPIFVGWPVFTVGAGIKIGNNCVLVSSSLWNPIGLFRPCIIGIINNGTLSIGDRFSASGCCIWAQKSVVIGDNVMLGANVTIIDNDFHSVNPEQRKMGGVVPSAKKIAIEDNVWIGMNSVILKGVTIGEGAIIGANSVVSTDVPRGAKVVSAHNRLLY